MPTFDETTIARIAEAVAREIGPARAMVGRESAIDVADDGSLRVHTKLKPSIARSQLPTDGTVAGIPACAGWFWCLLGPGRGGWECLMVHDPTGDGLEVAGRGPVADFNCVGWGLRIPYPWEV